MEYLDEIINIRIKPSQKEILKKRLKKKAGHEKIIKPEVQKLIGGYEFENKDLFPKPETKIFDLIEKVFCRSKPNAPF